MSACCSTGPADDAALKHSLDGQRAGDWLRLAIAALVAGQSMAFGIAVNVSPPEGEERAFLHALLAGSALFVFFAVGLPILRDAWRGALARQINMDQFFLLGICGAFAASLQATLTGKGNLYYEVVAVLVAIHTLGRILGERRRAAAVEAAGKLRAEFDACWKLTCCGQELRVPVSEIVPGDAVRVRSGEGVPVDGTVREGTAFVRETALTGETFPVVRRPGDAIYAGSILEDGTLIVEATQPGTARRFDQLLRSVDVAGQNKSRLQREADRIVQWFLPCVVAAACAIFFGWSVVAGWEVALMHALSAIVVACPCALGLATPLAVWNALNHLARKGVAIKSGEGLERLAAVDVAVFDKTGTLSSEVPTVVDFVVADGFDRDRVRGWIARAQAGSLHPVARAFASWAGAPPPGAEVGDFEIEEMPGAGISARIGEGILKIGNEGILEEAEAREAASRLAAAFYDHGSGNLKKFYVTFNGQVVAAAALRETLRDATGPTVAWFESQKIEARIMTGDPEWTAPEGFGLKNERIATGLRPEAKAELVKALAQRGSKVLFVGDGLNDAPAMRAAHASLAMGGGAELSRETATGEIFGGRIELAAETVRVARRTVSAMRGNMLYALVYNATGICLAASGMLHPVAAAIIMLVSSVTVSWRALNALDPGRDGESLRDFGEPAPAQTAAENSSPLEAESPAIPVADAKGRAARS